MHNPSNFNFISFKLSDNRDDYLDSIISIHNEILLTRSDLRNSADISTTGFLLIEIGREYIAKELDLGHSYYLCTNDNDHVLGYLVIAPKIPDDILSSVSWSSPSVEEKVSSSKHQYINLIVVSSKHAGKGVGRFIYNSLFSLHPKYCFSAFYVSSPVENTRSKMFHEKQGFKEAGFYQSDSFHGINNYQSILMLRESADD